MRAWSWLAAGAAMLVNAPAAAEWREAQTAHFIIYSESDSGRVEQLAERLETYDKLMRMAAGTPDDDPVKVRIYEVPDLGAIERALGEHNSGIAGFYDSNSLGPFLVTPRRTGNTGRYFTPELVLQHEYAHHFMLQYFPAIYPSWYVEGYAELIGSSMPMPDGRIGYGMPAKHRGNEILAYWVPLQELLTRERVTYLDTYGQGWALTHFMTFDKGRAQQFRRYLAELGRGTPPAQAATTAFADLGKLNADARRYVGSGSFAYTPVKVDIRRPVIQASRTLSAAEAALIPQVIAYRDDELTSIRKAADRAREERLRRANLHRIRQVAARYPNDPAALHLLALAERTAGNRTEALAAANRVLALRPDHGGGIVEKSLLMSDVAASLGEPQRQAAAAEARALAVRANKANNNDPLALVAYYQSFNRVGAKPTPTAVNGLMRAVELLPSNTTVRQLLVDSLAADRRWAAAIAALRPIANSPHPSPRRDAAREQLAKLQAALAGGQPAASGTARTSS